MRTVLFHVLHPISVSHPEGARDFSASATGKPEDRGSPPALLRTLEKNDPDPFRKKTEICYRVEEAGAVRLRVYDLMGRHVETLVDAAKEPSTYTVTFDGEALASGVYLYRLETDAGTQTRKMTLVR